MVWMKSHSWEIVALIIPVLLTICTPAFVGLAGFIAGGIAVGLSLNIHLDCRMSDIRISSIVVGI